MNKKGFTLIEVSLTLAIAGLIFLAVFLVLPGLWASERDAERRDDVIKLINNLKNFQTNNNRGALPENGATGATITWGASLDSANANSWAGFYRDFLREDFKDPSGNNYVLKVVDCGSKLNPTAACTNQDVSTNLQASKFPNNYTIYLVVGATCDGSTAIKSANNRKVAALYRLEQSNGIYCNNS